MKQTRHIHESTGRPPEILTSRLRRLVVCLLCILCFVTPVAAEKNGAKTAEELEYEVKAAFIYNFMKFIHWPGDKQIAASDASKDKPVRIAVIGRHPYKKTLLPILNKSVQGRPVELVEIEGLEEFRDSFADRRSALAAYKKRYQPRLTQCHLLFICRSEKTAYPELLTLTAGSAVVTVSDLSDFAAADGMIGFVRENRKIRFEVNLDAVQQENIRISSQLLGLAKRVYKK